MKKTILTLIALGSAALLFSAAAQTPPVTPDDTNAAATDQATPAPNTDTGGQPDTGTVSPDAAPADMGGDQPTDQAASVGNTSESGTVILPTKALGEDQTLKSSFTPPSDAGTNADAILLNFANAPLGEVLSYLSDAAGFIIVLDTQVNGRVSVISKHPMTRDEAVDLLNSVLNQNGYAAIRDGRTLTIMNKNDAMKSDIPVKVSNDPNEIPKNDEIVTQVIPIRFVDANDLVKDLSSFVSPQATVVANDAGNSIVITDTQANIRHLVEIIKAIDSSAEAETEIRVFPLKYASPTDVATELGSIFPSSNSSGNTQAPTRFAGGGGGSPFARFFGGGGGGGGGGQGNGGTAGNSSTDRIKKATAVTAVADARIQAVIVTAPKDLMEEIAGMMKALDVPSDRDQDVYVFKMNNGDPQQAVTVLQSMFQSSSSRNSSSSSSSSSALQTRQQNNNTTTSSSSTGTTGFGTSGGGGGGGRTY